MYQITKCEVIPSTLNSTITVSAMNSPHGAMYVIACDDSSNLAKDVIAEDVERETVSSQESNNDNGQINEPESLSKTAKTAYIKCITLPNSSVQNSDPVGHLKDGYSNSCCPVSAKASLVDEADQLVNTKSSTTGEHTPYDVHNDIPEMPDTKDESPITSSSVNSPNDDKTKDIQRGSPVIEKLGEEIYKKN